MAWVTPAFIETWKSKRYVGSKKPTTVVQVRRGSFRRAYRAGVSDIPGASIPGETTPWCPIFTETTPWVKIPGVLSVDTTKDFGQRGMTVVTLVVDNVDYVQATGPLGDVYQLIDRGALSPDRGFTPPTRARRGPAAGSWYDVLTENANIRVWQGFGEPEVDVNGVMPNSGGTNGAWVFNGLIDSVDPAARPSKLTITARAGKVLTDSRMFGWNISKQLKDPVTFADYDAAYNITKVGDTAVASSGTGAINVTDDDIATAKTYWTSQVAGGRDFTEWVEIRVPAGTYTSITLDCDAEMELFIGFLPRSDVLLGNATVNGTQVPAVFYGSNTVPGANGGWAYLYTQSFTLAGERVIDFGQTIRCFNDSVVRVGFRRLAPEPGNPAAYRARVRTFQARRGLLNPVAADGNWIVVDDVSDMVRVCLRWAGLFEWAVESTGAKLKGKLVFNRSNFLIDPILKAVELTGYNFFLADPVDGASYGVPTFRQNSALFRQGITLTELSDSDLLTDIKAHRTEEPLGYIIRVRGKVTNKGSTLGGSTTKRIMAVYRPPWTQDNTMAGIIKHVTITQNSLRTQTECLVACYLIAIQQILSAMTAAAEIPGYPPLELDDQVGIYDQSTGLNTRLWVNAISTTMRTGASPSWVTSFNGALIDTPDLVALIAEIDAIDFSPAKSPVGIWAGRLPRMR